MPRDRKQRNKAIRTRWEPVPAEPKSAADDLVLVEEQWVMDVRSALRDCLDIITRAGGFMSAEDQSLLRNARRVYEGK
jgi:hypothetical protein